MRWLTVIAIGMACACNDNVSMQDSPVGNFDDHGEVCLYGTPAQPPHTGEQEFKVGAPLYLDYRLEEVCLSSECTRNHQALCSVVVLGQVQRVTSLASWETIEGAYTDVACSDDCAFLHATCQTDALSPGEYTFTFGQESLSLVVPSQVPEPPCLRN